MNRLLKLQIQLNKVIGEQEGKVAERDESLDWERLHMASSARCAWILAMQRGGCDPVYIKGDPIHRFQSPVGLCDIFHLNFQISLLPIREASAYWRKSSC